MQKYCTIFVVRHGETEWNVKRLVQGHTDSPLTIAGKKQAAILAKELKNSKFDAVFSSDLLRAKRTAKIIAAEHKLAVETTKALRERNHGTLEGKPLEDLKALHDLREIAYESGFEKLGVETDEKLIGRLITFLREIAVAYRAKTVLVVTHGGAMRTLLVHLGFVARAQLPPGSIKNTAYIKLESDGVDFFVKKTWGINVNKV